MVRVLLQPFTLTRFEQRFLASDYTIGGASEKLTTTATQSAANL